MAIMGYCKKQACSDCKKPCKLDESIPCSPDCENLTEDGEILIEKCLKDECEEVKYIFGMPNATDGELMAAYGRRASYPYEI